MNLLAWPALALLASAAVLVLLAAWRTGPRQRDVGTLMIWRRVAEKSPSRKQRRRRLDWLLWLLLAVVGVSAIGAARPAWFLPGERPVVAVYVERGFTDMDAVRERAVEQAGEAELKFYTARPADEARRLNPGSIDAELAQFHARAGEADAYLYFLNRPADDTGGRVLPLVTQAAGGVVFEITAETGEIVIRYSGRDGLVVNGAERLDKAFSGGASTLVVRPVGEEVEIVEPEGRAYLLKRRPFVVGVGQGWSTSAHTALFNALGSDDAERAEPALWLGSAENSPAIRVGAGRTADLSQARLSYDPQHPLFAELPLSSFDWRSMAKAMPREPGTRPLLTAVRDGEVPVDVIRLRGDVLEFAGDPFSDAPIASAALLLDNAIGVLTGEQPSRRRGYEPAEEYELPTRRAALAEPFEPRGELEFGPVKEERPVEFSTWLLLAGGLLLLAAALLVSRRE